MLRAIYDFALAPLYFGGPKAPAPVPVQPALDTAAQDKARTDAKRAALAESKLSGRRATIVGGGLLAAEEQLGRGMASQAKRAAARAVLG